MLEETKTARDFREPKQRQRYITKWLQRRSWPKTFIRAHGDLTRRQKFLAAWAYHFYTTLGAIWVLEQFTSFGISSITLAFLGSVTAVGGKYGILPFFQNLPLAPRDTLFSQIRIVLNRATINLFLIIAFTSWGDEAIWFRDWDIGFYHSLSLILIFYGAALLTTFSSFVANYSREPLVRRRHYFLIGQYLLILKGHSVLQGLPGLNPKTALGLEIVALLSLAILTGWMLRDAVTLKRLQSTELAIFPGWGIAIAFFVLAVSPTRWIVGVIFLLGLFQRGSRLKRRPTLIPHGISLTILGLASGLEIVFSLGMASSLTILVSQWLLTVVGLLAMEWRPRPVGIAPEQHQHSPMNTEPARSTSRQAIVRSLVYDDWTPVAAVPYLSQTFRAWFIKPLAGLGSSWLALSAAVWVFTWLFLTPKAISIDVLLLFAALFATLRLYDVAFENPVLTVLPLSTRQVLEGAIRSAILPVVIVAGCLLAVTFRQELVEAPWQTTMDALSWQNLDVPVMLFSMLVFLILLSHPYGRRHGLPDRWKAAALLQGWAVLDSRAMASRLDVSRSTEIVVNLLALGLLVAVSAVSFRVFSRDLAAKATLVANRPEGSSTLNLGMLTLMTLAIMLFVPDGWHPVLLWFSILAFGTISVIRLTGLFTPRSPWSPKENTILTRTIPSFLRLLGVPGPHHSCGSGGHLRLRSDPVGATCPGLRLVCCAACL